MIDRQISDTEKRVLQNLHLRGFMGKMGAMKQADRVKLLQGLVAKGLIDANCNVTKLGIEKSI